MTVREYYTWFKRNWPFAGPLVALYLSVLFVLFVRPVNFPAFLIMLITPLYMIHETEEYIFPGGFGDFFNTRIFGIEGPDAPLGEDFIFAVNVGLVWLILPLFGILSFYRLPLGLWVPYFAVFAGIAHIPLSIKGRRLYNPGLIVSLLLNIPGGSAVIWYLSSQGIIVHPLFNVHLLIGLALNLLLPVSGMLLYRDYQKKQQGST